MTKSLSQCKVDKMPEFSNSLTSLLTSIDFACSSHSWIVAHWCFNGTGLTTSQFIFPEPFSSFLVLSAFCSSTSSCNVTWFACKCACCLIATKTFNTSDGCSVNCRTIWPMASVTNNWMTPVTSIFLIPSSDYGCIWWLLPCKCRSNETWKDKGALFYSSKCPKIKKRSRFATQHNRCGTLKSLVSHFSLAITIDKKYIPSKAELSFIFRNYFSVNDFWILIWFKKPLKVVQFKSRHKFENSKPQF